MKHRVFASALALSLALTLSPALAAEGDGRFPAVNSYPGYADVKESDWFYDNARLCFEIGLMQGTQNGFEPNKTLTIAELAAITARVRSAFIGVTIPDTGPAKPWYQVYFDYLSAPDDKAVSSIWGLVTQRFDTPELEATRYDMLYFLAAALDSFTEELPAINNIQNLPDVESDNLILYFYNRGILTGTDIYGTFAGYRTLMRSECAGMVSRIARSELRMPFVPADHTLFTAAGVSPDTVLFRNGLTAADYLPRVMARIQTMEQRDAALGVAFNWFHKAEDGSTYLDSVKQGALSELGVTRADGTQAYADFDVQVFYSRYLDLSGAVDEIAPASPR